MWMVSLNGNAGFPPRELVIRGRARRMRSHSRRWNYWLMSNPTHERIARLLADHRVVLFMKGTPQAPRCGFSATAASVMNQLAPGYLGVDVLADEAIRQGIKEYGNWPTIPQLYVDGELIGGSDIITQMYNAGELQTLLGAAAPDRTPPQITITPAAAQAIGAGMADDPGLALHLKIDARFQPQFQLATAAGHEIRAESAGIELLMDLDTAQRARGMVIDWVDQLSGSGLSVHLPQAPARVRGLSVEDLAQKLRAAAVTVIDVRPAADRERAPFAAAQVWEQNHAARLEALPKSTPLAFLCHHGNSSRSVAEHFRGLGFTELYNVDGGIDAWSVRIDPTTPRY